MQYLDQVVPNFLCPYNLDNVLKVCYVKVNGQCRCPVLENNELFTRSRKDRVINLLFSNIGDLRDYYPF